ncbi:hypothetical protein [Sporocytophaga sp.]|uniref:hypothetical protein n=1 Tax=Sporocytophaga sp. TaxID=2231183 RepID=UPI0025EFFB79|nr:hypothetical protein [Sporocytophaga sp.]
MNTQDLQNENNSSFCQEVKLAFEQLMTQFSMNVNKELKDEIYLESRWAGIFLGKDNNELTISIYSPKGKNRWYPKFYLSAFFGLNGKTKIDQSEGDSNLKELCSHADEIKESFASILRGDFSWDLDFEKWLAFLKQCQKDQDCDLPSFLQLVHEGHIEQ